MREILHGLVSCLGFLTRASLNQTPKSELSLQKKVESNRTVLSSDKLSPFPVCVV